MRGIPLHTLPFAHPLNAGHAATPTPAEEAFLAKNLYTEKSFQPVSSASSDGGLRQRTLGGSRLQYWEFLKQPDETYLVRLQGSELYLTAPAKETNSPAVLMPKQDSRGQAWRLVRQTPWI